MTEDHTPNDAGGKMFFVNANPRASAFFTATLSGFKKNTKYEFGVWMMNLCKLNGGCTALPPDILITLQTLDGKKVASFQTGQVSSGYTPVWKKYFAFFTTLPDATALNLRMAPFLLVDASSLLASWHEREPAFLNTPATPHECDAAALDLAA